ncbi:protein translocase subunit SecD [Aeoliella sp. ICT_H6.2]|uniref:Multifunctional fusion protein n=1 Tax=Aeoliella straminimaris TaxID=2954799 RepID=A0A9X2FGM6_9BACT|nr:protein translocase subunit SecD [Aeoliella straminimaris]MCO6048063.1 protein translocase subunit SecD [Aeoliella straminimaris]
MNKVTILRPWAALLIVFSLLAAGLTLAPSACLAQEAGTATAEQPADQPAAEPEAGTPEETAPAEETTSADQPAESQPAEEPAAEQPSADETPATEPEVSSDDAMEDLATEEVETTDDTPDEEAPVEEEFVEAETPADEKAAEEAAEGQAEKEAAEEAAADLESATGLSPWVMTLIILALFIVPGFIGSYFAKSLKMPDHGWKIAVVIGVAAAGILAVVSASTRENGFKLGPDLGGGVTLIYDLADPDSVKDEDDQSTTPDGEEEVSDGKRAPVSMDKMLSALKERVDPSGTKEVTIRRRGKSIEFIIPKAGQAELEYIKKKITELGQLEFRILADSQRNEDQEKIKIALTMPPGRTEVKSNNATIAKWVPYDVEEFGGIGEVGESPERDEVVVKRMGVNGPEILVIKDPFDVTGEYLSSASAGVGQEGHEVRFAFNSQGAFRFGKLTAAHIPNPRSYYLGVILDNKLRTAPGIRSKISTHGTISGRMTEEEVEHIADILNAGSLPAELNKTPVSEAQTGPEIGARTIEQGTRAMIGSMAIVLVFILVYYRFAGIVACMALVLNIVLVVAAMVLLNAAFTLPGLAGLVLTVGMSVDANVLIFERIREELSRGATLRMAIRNGFGRATTTIVDANVTTLITGLVLYVIGTDQIKGFAITLILGIIMSMYTAIFCSRLLFDIAERRGWITKLSMLHILNNSNLNFMSKWPVATGLSLLVIVVGMFGVASRGTNLLNIDFTGGTSVTMVLQEDHAMSQADVRAALEDTELGDKNLLVVERKQDGPEGTTFKIDCSVLDEVNEETGQPVFNAVDHVEEILGKTFNGKLETYEISATPIETFTEGAEGENQFRGFESTIRFGEESADEALVGVSHDTLLGDVQDVLDDLGMSGIAPVVTNPNYSEGSSRRFAEWNVRLAGVDQSQAQKVFDTVVERKNGQPIFPLANKIGGRVAGDMRLQAIYAIAVSLLGIIGYIWIRFQKISYGLAAVVALVHDVLVTLGVLALSAFLVQYAGGLAGALQVDAFQISLPIVAAFLTIIGYSLNDTIVVFDRIREVRGKSPTLTAEMINTSVNQTLSRTLLTSLTTLIVVVILYFFGGDGIHAFAFALVIGVIVGTYSSIFIASPVLLWLSKKEQNWSV